MQRRIWPRLFSTANAQLDFQSKLKKFSDAKKYKSMLTETLSRIDETSYFQNAEFNDFIIEKVAFFNLQVCENLFNRFKLKKYATSPLVYCSLIQGYTEHGRRKEIKQNPEAKQEYMEKCTKYYQIGLDIASKEEKTKLLSYQLRACAFVGSLNDICELFPLSSTPNEELEIPRDYYCYLHAVYGCLKFGKPDLAQQYLTEMKLRGFKADIMMLESMLSAYICYLENQNSSNISINPDSLVQGLVSTFIGDVNLDLRLDTYNLILQAYQTSKSYLAGITYYQQNIEAKLDDILKTASNPGAVKLFLNNVVFLASQLSESRYLLQILNDIARLRIDLTHSQAAYIISHYSKKKRRELIQQLFLIFYSYKYFNYPKILVPFRCRTPPEPLLLTKLAVFSYLDVVGIEAAKHFWEWVMTNHPTIADECIKYQGKRRLILDSIMK